MSIKSVVVFKVGNDNFNCSITYSNGEVKNFTNLTLDQLTEQVLSKLPTHILDSMIAAGQFNL